MGRTLRTNLKMKEYFLYPKPYHCGSIILARARGLPRQSAINQSGSLVPWEIAPQAFWKSLGKRQDVIVSNTLTGDVLGVVKSNKKGVWTLNVKNPPLCLPHSRRIRGELF